MNKIDKVKKYANKIIKSWFDDAPTGQGKPLKNYTSGDGDNIGFESITKNIIQYALSAYGLESRSKVNEDYFIDETGKYDKQRMDNHVWIDGKVVIVEENRAWVDKPFYTMKRGVVKSFMELPHVKKYLDENVKFIFSMLGVDVKDESRTTMDTVMGYGDFITEINFSGRSRGGRLIVESPDGARTLAKSDYKGIPSGLPRIKKSNYFTYEYSQEQLDKYVETLCGVFSEYE